MSDTTMCPTFKTECTKTCAACNYKYVRMGGQVISGRWCLEFETFVYPKEEQE